MGCNVGFKVRGKKDGQILLEFVELIAKKTMAQPTINQNKNENHQRSNPKLHNTPHNGYRKMS